MLIHPDKVDDLRSGRHRSSPRIHQPAHRGEYASFLARLLPSWTTRQPASRPAASRPDRGAAITAPRVAGRPDSDPIIEIDLDAASTAPEPDRAPFDFAMFESDLIVHERMDEARPAPTPADPAPPPDTAVSPPDSLPPTPPGDAAATTVVPAPSPPPTLPAWVPGPPGSIDPGTGDTALLPERPPRRRPRRITFADLLGFGIEADEDMATPEPEIEAPEESTSPLAGSWEDLSLRSAEANPVPIESRALVQRLWDATAEQPTPVPEAQLAPFDIQQMLRSNRTFRWSVVVGVIVFALIGAAILRAIGQRPVAIAEARAAAYEDRGERLAAALTGFDATARTITSPDTAVDRLGTMTGELLSVGSLAQELAAVTAEPLPEPSLLGESAPIDRLHSPQELFRQAAERALTIERRLGDTLSYRVLIARAFVMPELAVAATERETGDLGGRLSVVEATTEQVLSQLPEDAFFATHSERAWSLLNSYRTWQVDYLTALRDGDVATAGMLRREWQTTLAGFDTAIAGPLMAVDTWASQELGRLDELMDLAFTRLG